MNFIRLLTVFIIVIAFFTACGSFQTEETTDQSTNTNSREETLADFDGDYWAKDNFDLQRVGEILDESKDAKDFEYRLNSEDGLNNLDLNGDGYVDYISVSEFDDRADNQRGFSLFSRFDGNAIQELASIFFDRDRPDRPGARVYINGNDQIYGENYFYERNWLDKSLNIADWAFGDRDEYYRSPYYYDNYPDYYSAYRVTDTPVYRTRIDQLYPDPVFVKMVNPAMVKFKIKSPYKDKSFDKIYAKLVNPTRGQSEFGRNNPNRPEFVPIRNGNGRNNSGKPEKEIKTKDDGKDKNDKSASGDKPDKSDRKNTDNERGKNSPKDDKENEKKEKRDGGKPGKN